MKIIQPMQIEFAWQYLVLAVDVVRCKLSWAWANRMNQSCLMPIFEGWSPDAVIWDGASAHRGQDMDEVGFERIPLPPYSPELNPVNGSLNSCGARLRGKSMPPSITSDM